MGMRKTMSQLLMIARETGELDLRIKRLLAQRADS